MNRHSTRRPIAVVTFALSLLSSPLAPAQIPGLASPVAAAPKLAGTRESRELKLDSGITLKYAIILPEGFTSQQTYPVLLALPPGAQDQKMVEAGLGMYWEQEARSRGWVVVSPEAPAGSPFVGPGSEGSFTAIPALLDEISKTVTIEGGKVHLAGVSNGGRAAFRVATTFPDRFASLTVLPGSPPDAEDFAKLARLKGIPVAMFVGEQDRSWVKDSDKTAAKLRELGVVTAFEVLSGQSHVINIEAAKLFDIFEKARPRSGPKANGVDRPLNAGVPNAGDDKAAISQVLNDFHDAAAKADEARYFSHLTKNAVFLGTDATERWPREDFLAWARAKGLLRDGKGWTYTLIERWVTIHPTGETAWFDEMLANAKYGDCRGSGVLVKEGGTWRIAQYNLSKPVPNDLMNDLVESIRKWKEAQRNKSGNAPEKPAERPPPK